MERATAGSHLPTWPRRTSDRGLKRPLANLMGLTLRLPSIGSHNTGLADPFLVDCWIKTGRRIAANESGLLGVSSAGAAVLAGMVLFETVRNRTARATRCHSRRSRGRHCRSTVPIEMGETGTPDTFHHLCVWCDHPCPLVRRKGAG